MVKNRNKYILKEVFNMVKFKIWKNGTENEKFKLKEKARNFEASFEGQFGYSNIKKWVSKFLKDVGNAESSKELKKLQAELKNKEMEEKLKDQKMTARFNNIKENMRNIKRLSQSNETLISSLTSDTNSIFSIDSVSTTSTDSEKTRKFSRESLNKGTGRDIE